MRSSPAAQRLRARRLTIASMTVIAMLASAGAAAASGVVFVDELASPTGHTTVQRQSEGDRSVTLAGNLTTDLHQPNQTATGTYTGTAGSGHMAVGTHLSVQPGDFNFANTHVFAQYTDSIAVSGLAAGQSVTVHQVLHVSGSNTITEPSGPPGSGATARTDLTIEGTGIPEGPIFGSFDGPVYATSRHSRPANHLTDRDLSQDDIDLLFTLTSQGGSFFMDVELQTELEGFGGGRGDILAGYDISWGHGGFLTLNDAHGVDTGVRVGPGVTLRSPTGFNFLTGLNGSAGSAPEPASWALMIVGFGGVGAMLRRRGVAAG